VYSQKAPNINHVLRVYYTWDETATPTFRCCRGEEPVAEHVGGDKLEVFQVNGQFKLTLGRDQSAPSLIVNATPGILLVSPLIISKWKKKTPRVSLL
jgi:hypothetical protein